MVKRSCLSLTLLLLAACTAVTRPSPTPEAVELAEQEQAVYRAALVYLYDAPTYVLHSSTTVTDLANSSETLDYIRENLPGLQEETIDSFREANASPSDLAADMDLGVPYLLLTSEEQNKLFSQNQDGWQIFYDRYPAAPGISELGRPGFNRDRDQALVYVGTQSHWLAGAGYYLLLGKTGGSWTVLQIVMAWIS